MTDPIVLQNRHDSLDLDFLVKSFQDISIDWSPDRSRSTNKTVLFTTQSRIISVYDLIVQLNICCYTPVYVGDISLVYSQILKTIEYLERMIRGVAKTVRLANEHEFKLFVYLPEGITMNLFEVTARGVTETILSTKLRRPCDEHKYSFFFQTPGNLSDLGKRQNSEAFLGKTKKLKEK